MIDRLLSLAMSMHSCKGVYALLLGSGVSRSAGIPTGWDIVLDLIRKLASIKGEAADPDPEAWYQALAGVRPDYSDILDEIARSPPSVRNCCGRISSRPLRSGKMARNFRLTRIGQSRGWWQEVMSGLSSLQTSTV